MAEGNHSFEKSSCNQMQPFRRISRFINVRSKSVNAQFVSVNAEYNNRFVRSKRAVLYEMKGKKCT